jgi:DNA (cytosine-5)-methyltransferase 1
MKKNLVGASLFSSSGIAEYYFNDLGIEIKTANELLPKRASLYNFFYPNTKMVIGSITDPLIFKEVLENINLTKAKFLIATPPCQGMSSLGKKEYSIDKRNYLVFYIFDIIDKSNFDYILIENVSKFLKLFFPYDNKLMKLEDIVKIKYSKMYNIETFILNAADYGVPQSRPRGFIKIYKKGLYWSNPNPQERIPLKKSIGHLPSLEAGQSSSIRWHNAKQHNQRELTAMRNTPEGKSALKNTKYYPIKENGIRIKGFHNTFKRMKWDEPAPARAMNSGNIGGHNNVHPGRLMADGTYSDARVLTLRELFIVSSLPADIELPEWCSDNFIRTVIGEAIPPFFSKNILSGIKTVKKLF